MPILGDSFICQDGEPFSEFVELIRARARHGRTAPSLVHVVNPFRSDDDGVQRATLDSLERARRWETACGREALLRQVGVVAPGELPSGLDGLDAVLSLERDDTRPKVFDVLECAREEAGEFVVFTNMDICVGVAFYEGVRALLELGCDALIINRRTVHAPVGEALASFDLGEAHPGMDCFVFPRAWIDGFVRSEAVIGYGGVMRGLLYNLVARAELFGFVRDAHFTHHFGDDRVWVEHQAERAFNRAEATRVFEQLCEDDAARQRLEQFVERMPSYRA